jgi:DNA gyrase subunit A
LIQHRDAPLAKIMEFVTGPDFPTGGQILGRQGIFDAYTKGRGQLKIRAKTKREAIGKDREAIIVTEIPYQVNKSRLIEQMSTLVNEKKVEGISDIRDESDRDGTRIVLELKRGEQPEVVLNNLYKHSQLQIGFGVIMLSIVNGQPRELGLVPMIKYFLDHRVEVVRRRTEYELRKAREREHLLLGFQKALQNLDEVIRLIRAARAPKEARDSLITAFDFSEKQAQAIIELQLQRLTGMEQQKILDELADIQRRIAEFLEILGSDKVLRDLIIKELKDVQKEFGDERRTEIIEDTGEIRLEDLVAVEDVAVTVTRGGYLKRTAVDTYRRQTRGGKGRIGMGTRAEDFVEHLIVASTHSYLLMFTTRGRVYWLKIYEIPDATTVGKGKHINNLINLQDDETVKAFLSVKDFVPDKFVVMVTKHGVIKKSELSEFDNPMSRGIIAVSLDEGDELIAAKITNGNNYIFLGSHEGQAIRFEEHHVRPMGRQARGVRAMDLAEGDYLVGMEVVEKEGTILSIAENGYGKRTPLETYRLTNRGGKGVINMKTTNKTGMVVALLSVKEDSEVILVSQNGKIIRMDSSTIRQAGRSTSGVKLVTLEEGDKVAAASVIPETENGNGNGNGQEDLPLQ